MTIRTLFAARVAAAVVALVHLPLVSAGQDLRDDLPRRGMLGFQLEPLPDGAVRVEMTVPGSAAAEAGLLPGDIIVSIGDEPIENLGALSGVMQNVRTGAPIEITVLRDGKTITAEALPKPRPTPASPGATTRLGSVRLATGDRLRTVTIIPDGAEKPAPVVFLIQGISCGSIEFGAAPGPFRAQVDRLVGEGFAVHMVEKPGVGDSEGPPCDQVGFDLELEGYLRGLDSLDTADGLDRQRVYLFGISMGGIMAPAIASEREVAGVCVFGTGVTNWFDYLLRNPRRQSITFDKSARVSIEGTANLKARFLAELILNQRTPAEIVEAQPDLAPVAPLTEGGMTYAGRAPRFHGELASRNIFEFWAGVGAPTLVIHGEYDWVCDPADQSLIVEVVNAENPGLADLLVLDRMDHAFTTHPDLASSFTNLFQGEWDDTVGREIASWIRRVEAGGR